jgi:hypothetical protein
MKITKPGSYEHELVGTCTRCGQVQECDKAGNIAPYVLTSFPHMVVYEVKCLLCGNTIRMEEKLRAAEGSPDKIELMAFLDIRKFHSVGAISEALLETYDIRRKQ